VGHRKPNAMLQLRALDTLECRNRDWLNARRHFTVDSRGDPAHARLGTLAVWNDDEIAPQGGFPMQ
jgi:quercetin 2,3-dioxygenase